MKLDYNNKNIIQEFINSSNLYNISSYNTAFTIYKKLQYSDKDISNSVSVSNRIYVIKKQIDYIQKSIVNILYENNNRTAKGMKCGYVYAIQNPAWKDYIKVGCAIDVYDRLNSYQTSTPLRDYALIDYVYSEDRLLLESEIHSKYECSGEWIKATKEDIKSQLKSYKKYPEIDIIKFALTEAINSFYNLDLINKEYTDRAIIKRIIKQYSTYLSKLYSIGVNDIINEADKKNSINFNNNKTKAKFKYMNLEFTMKDNSIIIQL